VQDLWVDMARVERSVEMGVKCQKAVRCQQAVKSAKERSGDVGISLPSSRNGCSKGRLERGHNELDIPTRLVQKMPQNSTRDDVSALRASSMDSLTNQRKTPIRTQLLFKIVSDRWSLKQALNK
jgi:hypothetical protein